MDWDTNAKCADTKVHSSRFSDNKNKVETESEDINFTQIFSKSADWQIIRQETKAEQKVRTSHLPEINVKWWDYKLDGQYKMLINKKNYGSQK